MTALNSAAWDRETHVAIVDAALRISPAARARVPANQSEVLRRSAGEPDLLDRECQFHPTDTGLKAPSTEAERALRQLRSGKGVERPYARAQAIGRYLHYVADAIMPSALVGLEHPSPANELFSNRSFVVFYEGRPLREPLAASLQERGAEARWGDPGEGSLTAAFRNAVNATAEALLLLPPEQGAAVATGGGPALFLVNTLDTGLGSVKTGQKFTGYKVEDTKNDGRVVTRQYRDIRSADPASGHGAYLISEKPGLTILEWNVRAAETGVAVRALVLNNDDTCATKIVLKRGGWEKHLPIQIGPRSIAAVEFDGPAGLSPEGMLRTWTPQPCAGPFDASQGFPTVRRVIIGLGGRVPSFDEPETRAGK